MKISKFLFKQIIKEELQKTTLDEAHASERENQAVARMEKLMIAADNLYEDLLSADFTHIAQFLIKNFEEYALMWKRHMESRDKDWEDEDHEDYEEELDEGLLDMFRKEKKPEFKPSRHDLSRAEWEDHKHTGELADPKDAAALENSYKHIQTFLEDEKQLDNVERYHAMQKLIRKLSDEMIWTK